jgi:molybdopterin synthase sulfur carrier subunit
MKIILKYFGEIAEILGTEEETLIISSPISLNELMNQFLAKSKKLNQLVIKTAVNNKLIDHNITLENNDVISFLPPFAGG